MPNGTVEWEDFTGGYFVGALGTKQPANTWVGDNVWVDPNTGELVPMSPLVLNDVGDGVAVTYTNVPGDFGLFTYPIRVFLDQADNGSMVWAQLNSGGAAWDWFRLDCTGSPAEVKKGSATFNSSIDRAFAVPAVGQVAGVDHAFLPSDSTHITRIGLSSLTVTTSVVGAIGNRIARWGDRMVSWVKESSSSLGTNVLYFSNATDYLTWPTTNFYVVGDDQSIQTVVVTPGTLLVGKRSGWWEIQGVLGSTATIRQLSVSTGPGAEHAHQVSQGVVMYDGYPMRSTSLGLVGLYPRVLNARLSYYGQNFSRVSMSGLLVGFDFQPQSDGAGWRGWIYDAVPGRWMRYLVGVGELFSADAPDGVTLLWAWDYDGLVSTSHNPAEPTVGITSTANDSQPRIIAFSGGLRGTATTDQVPPTGREATVLLAPHYARPGELDQVTDVLVEVSVGNPVPATSASVARVTVRVKAISAPDLNPAPTAEPFSSPFVWERQANQLTAGERMMVRFSPSDLPAAAMLQPEVTFENVKLRRVVLLVNRRAM